MYARVVVDTEGASYLDSFTYEVPEDLLGNPPHPDPLPLRGEGDPPSPQPSPAGGEGGPAPAGPMAGPSTSSGWPGHYTGSVRPGACVLVPFGSGQSIGYVVALEETSDIPRMKAILAVIESPITLPPELIDLAEWISGRYVCGLSRCAHSILPGVVQCKVRTMIELVQDASETDSPIAKLIEDAGGSVSAESLRAKIPGLPAKLRKLEQDGVIRRRYELISPEGKELTAPAVVLGIPPEQVEAGAESLESRSPRQAELLRFVAAEGTVPMSRINSELKVTAGVAAALVSKGLLKRTSFAIRRSPAHTVTPSTAHFELTPDQERSLRTAKDAVQARKHEVLLMHGVTASGKTEVYLRAIEHTTGIGLRSLVLLPEISLTTQVLNIFRGRFGDRVAVLHSGLSAGERFDEWMKAQNGEVDVVLGARSAVFAPLENLGLVIVDEEHEPTYKQDSDPRYHGRDVALRRAEANNALAILGSATPSVESYFFAKSGKYRLEVLSERVKSLPMPDVTVADLREEYQKGKPTIFTERLSEAIASTLANRQQVILFQNRRAYATFLLCRECGYTAECPNCAVSLKLHAAEKMLRCHHCEHEEDAPTTCPTCGGRKIGKFGIGTERIEEETRSAFPDARLLRMDRDTTTRKGSHRAILDAFRKHEADILIGTQMIAKGLDFPGVTLVGVISADTSLNLPDFRAGERTFQLLCQVSGRAGRGEQAGEVVIQTFNPEHYAVVAAAAHDYEGFYAQEIELRRELSYPPFAALVNVVASDPSEVEARKRLNQFVDALREKSAGYEVPIDLLGPVPAPVAKLRGQARWHVVVRSRDRDILLRAVRDALDSHPTVRRGVVVDIDPASML